MKTVVEMPVDRASRAVWLRRAREELRRETTIGPTDGPIVLSESHRTCLNGVRCVVCGSTGHPVDPLGRCEDCGPDGSPTVAIYQLLIEQPSYSRIYRE